MVRGMGGLKKGRQMGRATSRERGEISVIAVSLQKETSELKKKEVSVLKRGLLCNDEGKLKKKKKRGMRKRERLNEKFIFFFYWRRQPVKLKKKGSVGDN